VDTFPHLDRHHDSDIGNPEIQLVEQTQRLIRKGFAMASVEGCISGSFRLTLRSRH
jgi:hypothetical protein